MNASPVKPVAADAERLPAPTTRMAVRVIRMDKLPVLQVYSALALIFLFLPVIMLMLMSFNNSTTGVFPLKGFTLKWYSTALENKILWPALKNSVLVAAGTATVAALLGTPAAFALTRHSFRFKNALRGLMVLPTSLPTLLIGVSLLSFFALISLQRSLFTVIIGHVVYCVPYMLLVVSARLSEFDFSVEEAAMDLGATPLQTLRRVTFPLIQPTVIGAMLLIFAQSFDMFVITYFNIGPQSTLPMVIWSMMRTGINPSLNALGTMVLLFSIVLLTIAQKFGAIRLGS
jgi:spermidine/putrescine transport system permease protein